MGHRESGCRERPGGVRNRKESKRIEFVIRHGPGEPVPGTHSMTTRRLPTKTECSNVMDATPESPNAGPRTPTGAEPFRIVNQRYPRWVVVAENVFVAGMLAAFAVIEILGLWLFDSRTTLIALFVAFLAISPIAIRGWLLIWDLSRPGPGRGVTKRAILDRMFRGIRRKELPAEIEWAVLTAVRSLLPSVHTVHQLKFGEQVGYLHFLFPLAAVTRVRFAPEPDEDFNEFEPARRLHQATVEIHSGRQFQLIVDESDAARLRQWAIDKGISICEADDPRPQ